MAKRIIKLTETELNNIIKKVIAEETLSSNLTKPLSNLARPTIKSVPEPKTLPYDYSDFATGDELSNKGNVPAQPVVKKTIFGRGDSGPEVLAFQKQLAALGYNVGKKGADGVFGPDTEASVKQFQSKYGIKVSGRVGPPTKAKLTAVASAPKTTYDPNAEWNQDGRELWTDPNAGKPAAPAALPAKGGLVRNSPAGQAISRGLDKARASRSATKAGLDAYNKKNPNAGGAGSGWLTKKLAEK